MNNSGLRGTTAAQDTVSACCNIGLPTIESLLPDTMQCQQRFSNKETKALRGTKFPAEFDQKVGATNRSD